MFRFILSGMLLGIALSISTILSVSCVSKKPEPISVVIKKEIEPERYVYRLYINNSSGYEVLGTGFKVQYQNKTYLMSAQHVCELFVGPNFPLIETQSGYVTLKVLRTSKKLDLCLLEVPKELSRDSNAISISEQNLKRGDKVEIIGFPRGIFKLIVHAIYLGTHKIDYPPADFNGRVMDSANYFAIGGQSGGPVVNDHSELVGVLTMSFRDISLFVPLNEIKEFLRTSNQ